MYLNMALQQNLWVVDEDLYLRDTELSEEKHGRGIAMVGHK